MKQSLKHLDTIRHLGAIGTMSKRFSVTLSDGEYADLRRLAEEDGAELASRAAFFIQKEVFEYRKRKGLVANQLVNFIQILLRKAGCDLPSLSALEKIVGVDQDELRGLTHSLENLEMLKGAMKSLLESRDFDGYSIAELSELLNCDPRELDEFVDALSRGKRENNRAAKT